MSLSAETVAKLPTLSRLLWECGHHVNPEVYPVDLRDNPNASMWTVIETASKMRAERGNWPGPFTTGFTDLYDATRKGELSLWANQLLIGDLLKPYAKPKHGDYELFFTRRGGTGIYIMVIRDDWEMREFVRRATRNNTTRLLPRVGPQTSRDGPHSASEGHAGV